MTKEIRDAIATASDYLTQHPEEARYTDSMAVAEIEAGLRMSVSGPNGESLVADMPGGVGGAGSAPSPGWYLRASVAACVASLAVMRAAQVGIEDFRCSVEVDSESDDRGILGLDDSVPAGPLAMRIKFRFQGEMSDRLSEMARWAVDHCPVSDAVRRAIPLELELLT